MTEVVATNEDLDVIRGILINERSKGILVPLLPMDVDLNNDGIVDAFGLDENDNVIVVPGVDLEHTVYESQGEDVDWSGE